MALQRRHLLAFLATAAAHLGLGFAIGSGSYREAAPVPRGEQPVLVVYLHQPDRVTTTASAPTPAQAVAADVQPAQAAPAQPAQESMPEQAVTRPIALRHFPLSVLTQAPQLASGLVGDGLLVVPGIAPQHATIQVWINDQGDVDKVAIEDSELPEEEQQRVIAAFSAVKFYAGKIGRITVSSQMSMDILLDSEVRL